MTESEKITRKKRIDLSLKKSGWRIIPYELGLNRSPILERHGGWGKSRKIFSQDAETLKEINAAIAA